MLTPLFVTLSALIGVILSEPASRSPIIGNIIPTNHPNLCVVPRGNSDANATPVQLTNCSDGSVSWTFNDGSFLVFNNQCMDVTNGNDINRTPLQTFACSGGVNQQIAPEGQALIWTGSPGQNKCVDVTDGVFAPGTVLQIFDCTNGANQLFTFPA